MTLIVFERSIKSVQPFKFVVGMCPHLGNGSLPQYNCTSFSSQMFYRYNEDFHSYWIDGRTIWCSSLKIHGTPFRFGISKIRKCGDGTGQNLPEAVGSHGFSGKYLATRQQLRVSKYLNKICHGTPGTRNMYGYPGKASMLKPGSALPHRLGPAPATIERESGEGHGASTAGAANVPPRFHPLRQPEWGTETDGLGLGGTTFAAFRKGSAYPSKL